MRKFLIGTAAAAALTFASVSAAGAVEPSCWGQASAVFAQTGEMGAHSSSFATPRLGLRNLARQVLGPDATMADLGVFVANELNLSIDACQG
jgi:hypothetical protein